MARPVFIPHNNVKQIEYLTERLRQHHKCSPDVFDVSDEGHDSEQDEVHMNTSASERKCRVYVHHFNRIPSQCSNHVGNTWRCGNHIHQTLYKHEFSDHGGARVHYLKKQFNNLTLNPRAMNHTSGKMPKYNSAHHKHSLADSYNNYNYRSTKMPQVKSTPIAKINKSFLLKPENKAVVDKLEESYWSKWKPSKTTTSKVHYPKTKGLYTENEKINTNYQCTTTNKKNERGDSSEAILTHTVQQSKTILKVSNPSVDQCMNQETEVCSQTTECDLQESKKSDFLATKDDCSSEIQTTEQEITSIYQTISVSEQNSEDNTLAHTVTDKTDSETNISILKHTDSFILTSKKQSQDKHHYQQPKCIKLFKNSDYSTTATVNYIKGGTYPLKSCLKRSSIEVKQSSSLGPPGSGPRLNLRIRKPGKAN